MSKHRRDEAHAKIGEMEEDIAAAVPPLPEIREIVPVAGTGQHVDPVLIEIVLDVLDGFESLAGGGDSGRLH